MGPALQNTVLPGGGQGRPPLQNPIGKRCVGAGGCPPSCQPIPGHCRVRQSGHFLETGSLPLPLAALRRFLRRPELGLYRIPCNVSLRGRAAPVAIRTPSPTECLPMAVCRGRCPHRPAGFCAGLSVNHRVIARARRTRGNPSTKPPLPKGGDQPQAGGGICEGKNPPVTASPCQPPLGKGAINLSDASHPSSYRISQRTCWENIFYQLSFIPNRIDCSFSFQRLSVWMTSSSVSVFGRICKMENWKNLYRSGCAQITSFISLLCPCSEST